MSEVYVFDDLNPEDNAMIQALYSRSPASVLNHREKVSAVGSGNFMSQFYVGYGHASIGDCGTTTIFIENVSMLVAKAIQDNPLYSGQEASTRYLDFSKQPQYDPYNHESSKVILAKWLELYNTYMPLVIEGLKVNHPFNSDKDKSEKVWLKTIEVRAFDILRSLLPVGTTTLLSWSTNLRQARDHLRYLSSHPLEEVRTIALEIFSALKEKYPHSFNGEEMAVESSYYHDRNIYAQNNAQDTHYLTPSSVFESLNSHDFEDLCYGKIVNQNLVNVRRANQDTALLNRPQGSSLPKRFIKYGNYNLNFLLDFGSFRDLQRHRNGYCPVPLVMGWLGFYKGYLTEFEKVLSVEDYKSLRTAMSDQFLAINSLPDKGILTSDVENQYLYPMGMACACELSYTIPQMVYVAELRSGKTVHFTLRPLSQELGNILKHDFPKLNLYVDYDEDSFTTRRGEQDIVVKDKVA